eukprot:gene2934-1916_t
MGVVIVIGVFDAGLTVHAAFVILVLGYFGFIYVVCVLLWVLWLICNFMVVFKLDCFPYMMGWMLHTLLIVLIYSLLYFISVVNFLAFVFMKFIMSVVLVEVFGYCTCMSDCVLWFCGFILCLIWAVSMLAGYSYYDLLVVLLADNACTLFLTAGIYDMILLIHGCLWISGFISVIYLPERANCGRVIWDVGCCFVCIGVSDSLMVAVLRFGCHAVHCGIYFVVFGLCCCFGLPVLHVFLADLLKVVVVIYVAGFNAGFFAAARMLIGGVIADDCEYACIVPVNFVHNEVSVGVLLIICKGVYVPCERGMTLDPMIGVFPFVGLLLTCRSVMKLGLQMRFTMVRVTIRILHGFNRLFYLLFGCFRGDSLYVYFAVIRFMLRFCYYSLWFVLFASLVDYNMWDFLYLVWCCVWCFVCFGYKLLELVVVNLILFKALEFDNKTGMIPRDEFVIGCAVCSLRIIAWEFYVDLFSGECFCLLFRVCASCLLDLLILIYYMWYCNSDNLLHCCFVILLDWVDVIVLICL